MKKLLLTISLIAAVALVLTGCGLQEAASQVVQHDGDTGADLMPEEGKFFVLERTDKVSDIKDIVEVSYDGQVVFRNPLTAENVQEATTDELEKMYNLIRDKDFEGLKQELKLDNADAANFDETLTLFTPEGQQEIFNLTAEDLGTGENTFLPDQWDVWLTKVRRFLGSLTGEGY